MYTEKGSDLTNNGFSNYKFLLEQLMHYILITKSITPTYVSA
jgi:hypothetical protein